MIIDRLDKNLHHIIQKQTHATLHKTTPTAFIFKPDIHVFKQQRHLAKLVNYINQTCKMTLISFLMKIYTRLLTFHTF